ncbi:hypothetical protein EV360DRAFT_52354 [Lentinula raphanica]|nr:hypothetical protein EV360DRAFT_52354 [Lentinula raphanica]
MVPSFSFVVLLAATAFTQLARADVVPNTPSTGKAGSTCTITWSGDSNSTSNWSNMAIEFMTGDNFDMVFLTTVATGLDGTKSGTYSWTCPDVTIYSAIYFYQFISPTEVENPVWTTRFAIASASGDTTTPPNDTQPDGEAIPWGKGALVDASSASAAPAFASGVTVTSGSIPATTASSSSSVSSVATTKSGSASSSVTTSSAHAAATSASANAGLGLAVDGRVWTAVVGVMSSAMAIALFL